MVVTTRTWAGAREPGTARNGARRACRTPVSMPANMSGWWNNSLRKAAGMCSAVMGMLPFGRMAPGASSWEGCLSARCHGHERNNRVVVLSYLLEATYHRSESQRLKLEGAADALAARNDLLDMRLDCGDDILPDVLGVVGHLHVDIAGVGQDLVDLDVEVDAATRSELVACCDFVRTAGRLLVGSVELSLVGDRVGHFDQLAIKLIRLRWRCWLSFTKRDELSGLCSRVWCDGG